MKTEKKFLARSIVYSREREAVLFQERQYEEETTRLSLPTISYEGEHLLASRMSDELSQSLGTQVDVITLDTHEGNYLDLMYVLALCDDEFEKECWKWIRTDEIGTQTIAFDHKEAVLERLSTIGEQLASSA